MRMRNWTTREDKFLLSNYKSMSFEMIAQILKRPVSGVSRRLLRLGVKKHTAPKKVIVEGGDKVCNKCFSVLPRNRKHYYVQTANKDEFMNTCKECFNTLYLSKKEKSPCKNFTPKVSVKEVGKSEKKPILCRSPKISTRILKLPNVPNSILITKNPEVNRILNTLTNVARQVFSGFVSEIVSEVTKRLSVK